MKYRLNLLLMLFSLVGCTQNFISYVKTPSIHDMSLENVLLGVGLLDPISVDRTFAHTNVNYPTGSLQATRERLVRDFNTLEISRYTPFEVSVNIKNYLIANPYYASEGFIYQADISTPNQGKFVFVSGEKSGQLKIRMYTPEGLLYSESTWYIEII